MKNWTLITCSYNTPNVTLNMLRSWIHVHGNIPRRLVIVENSTNEDTKHILEKNNVEYISNTGGTHGPSVDIAISKCVTDYALLVDTDIIFKQHHGDLFNLFEDHDLTLMGKVEGDRGGKHIRNRVNPWHCFINVKHLKENGISFFDESRFKAALKTDYIYDVGSTLFEDVRREGLNIADMDFHGKYYVHFEGLSWYTNKYDSSKQDTHSIDFDPCGSHNNKALFDIGIQKHSQYEAYTAYLQTTSILNKFTHQEEETKLGVAYNLFDGEEILEDSISSIRDNVDFITVVYQRQSNFGNPVKYDPIELLNSLKQNQLIDAYIEYEYAATIPAQQQEVIKRNIGISCCLEAGCTHFMTMDVDELYEPNEFKNAKQKVINSGKDSSACQMITYYKSKDFFLWPLPDYYVPFIYKIDPNSKFEYAHPFPVEVDPSRRIKTDSCLVFGRDEIQMHHMSYVRSNIRDKFINSSASINYKDTISELVEQYENWEYGKPALIAGRPNTLCEVKRVQPNTNCIFSCYFFTKKDPQREGCWPKDDYSKIEKWKESIEYLNMNGIIFHDGLSSDFIDAHTTQHIKFVKCTDQYKWSTNDFRFLIYNQYLKNNPHIKNVFFTDISDVILKHNPFDHTTKQDKIFVGTDEIGNFPNTIWATIESYGKIPKYIDTWRKSTGPVLNAGVMGGTRNTMIKFTDDMICEFNELNESRRNTNMAVFNYVAYSKYRDIIVPGAPVCSRFKKYENNRDDVWFIHK